MVLLGLLFFGAVGWFIYVRIKASKTRGEADDKYNTVTSGKESTEDLAKRELDSLMKSEKIDDDEEALS